MSGIYGIWKPLKKVVNDTADIDRLKRWNMAYGNEQEMLYIGEEIGMGCSYEKLSETAPKSSPVLQRDGKYAVIDAVLYNREEMIEKGFFSKELSDEELLLSYVEKFGYDALCEVNGDFVGGIYEVQNNSLTLFRDHMGVRPLFYYAQEQSVVFSTDIRGLTSMEQIDVTVDEKWLWNKVAGTAYTGMENTEFAHIFCVKPASYMAIALKNNQLTINTKSYWQIGRKKMRLSSEEAYIEKLRELITDSIKRRLDVISGPIGAELSGGLDSSVIDILIHRLGREAVYFSWSASPEEVPYAEDDERLVVEDICKQENISCHYAGKVLQIGEDSIIYKKMCAMGIQPDMRAGFYRRYVFPPYINTLHVCQASQYVNSQGAKVVFTGHSGDEGVSHRCNPYELFYHKEYGHYLKYMWDSTKGEKHRWYNTLLRCRQNLTVSRQKLTNPFVSILDSKDMLKKEFYEKYNVKKGVPQTFAYDPISYIRNGGSRNRLDVVALLGAYSGARYIIPYIDYRVIDYAVSIPRHMYLKKQKNRYIFREAFKDIMPDSLYNLRGKEDTSWRNAKGKEKNPTEYLERKKRLLGMLDRKYWNQYLEWKVLEDWANIPLNEADEMRDFAIFSAIDNCLSLQNMIQFSREL